MALCNVDKLPKTLCNRFRQPLYATAYGNGKELFGQRLGNHRITAYEMAGNCLGNH